ncbi:minor capsid protein [Geobacter pelophilus]|uniref:Minor capsid protein n=1 Tax=Geoanaerobacter pelophilus TaxID=60036 RepID=A0AAW4L619_9BACT|nr:phage minor head protein [Geoanaerobacter pelophilus]MBT0666343.1 minor capsid protein [Geoanaerobacter pelophilus]
MDSIDISYLFTLPPQKAIEYLQTKGFKITFDWHELLDSAHAQAFTVAKAMDLDVLQSIKSALVQALEKGESFRTFQQQLTPKLQALGWWGKEEILNPATGELRVAQLGSPYRLRTIYEANLQSAYQAGRWQSQWENRADRPYLMYVAVLDSRTRPAHRALHGTIAPIDSPFWRYFYPPNGWRCRCRVRSLTQEQATAMVKDGQGVWVAEDGLGSKQIEISHSGGEMGTVAVYRGADALGRSFAISPDLGWSSNPGMAKWQPDLTRYDADVRALWPR